MSILVAVLVVLLLGVGAATAVLFRERRKLVEEVERGSRKYTDAIGRFQGVVDADAERDRVLSGLATERSTILGELDSQRLSALRDVEKVRAEQSQREREARSIEARIRELQSALSTLEETAHLQSFGFYKPRYNFDSSSRYQAKLEQIRAQQKAMLSAKSAALAHSEWTVNGSVVEGRKQINQTLKLMLRAFNGECDAAIAKVKYNNVGAMEGRINKAREAIDALVTVQQCTIAPQFLSLKLQELYLVHEYEEKVQEEKEEQRRIREQMREEEIALRELEKAQQEAEKEEARAAQALAKARAEIESATGAKHDKLLAQIQELERRVAEAEAKKRRAISQAQLTRSGHVYVISNVGSFGEEVYKIGMTRRLDPMDRVRELGDASVPFHFDVHAIIFTDDAPKLENSLHRAFHQRRVNRVNERKEFFRVSLDEIALAVHRTHGAEIEFTKVAEAMEFRKTVSMGDAHVATPAPAAVLEYAD